VALTFTGGDTDKVEWTIQTPSSNLAQCTWLAWVYGITFGNGRGIAQNGEGAGFSALSVRSTGQLNYDLDMSTTDATARSANSAGNVLVANTWQFVAATADASFVPRLYLGTLTTLAVECAYATQTTGVGSRISDVLSTGRIGNRGFSDSLSFGGRIAIVAYENVALSLAQIQSWQFRPRKLPSTVIFHILGLAGTGTHGDLSGNGHTGTVTGAVVGDHVPLAMPFAGAVWMPYVVSVGGTTYFQSMGGTVTPAGALSKDARKLFAGGITPSGALGKAVSNALGGSVSPSGALVRQVGRTAGGSIVPTGVQTARIGKVHTGTVTPTGALVRSTGKVLAGVLVPVGGLIKQTSNSLGGVVAPTGTLLAVRTVLMSLAGALTPTGTLVRLINKALAGALTPTGSMLKSAMRVLGGGVTPTGTLVSSLTRILSLGGVVTPTGAVLRQVQRSLSGTVASTGTLVHGVNKLFGGTITPTGMLQAVRTLYVSLAGTVAPTGTVSTVVIPFVAGAVKKFFMLLGVGK
jgi:hypothetical protein